MARKSSYILFSLLSAMFFQRAIFVLFLLERGVSNTDIGFFQMLLLGAMILADYPIGIVSDKFGRKFTLLLGCVLMLVNGLAMTLVDSFYMFALLFIIEGIGFAALSNSLESLIYEDSKKHNYDFSKFFSMITFVASIGLGFSIYIGGISYKFDINYPFYETCLVSVFSIFVLFFIKEDKTKIEGERSVTAIAKESILFLKENMSFSLWRLVAIYASIFSVTAPFIIFFQEALSEKGFNTSDIGLVIGVSEVLGAAVVAIFSKYLVDKKIDITFYILLLFASTLVIYLESDALAIISVFVVSLLSTLIWVVLNQEMHDVLVDEIRNSAMSIVTSIIALFMAVSYWVFGALIDWIGIVNTLSISGSLPLITLITFAFFEQLKVKQPHVKA